MGEERHLEGLSDTALFIYLPNGHEWQFFFSHVKFDACLLKMHKRMSAEKAPCHLNMLPLYMIMLEVVYETSCNHSAVKGLCHMVALWLFHNASTHMHLASGIVEYETIRYY